jgi:hypothetical protein
VVLRSRQAPRNEWSAGLRLVLPRSKLLSPAKSPNVRLRGLLSAEDSRVVHRLVLRCVLQVSSVIIRCFSAVVLAQLWGVPFSQGLSTRDAGPPAAIALRAVAVGAIPTRAIADDREGMVSCMREMVSEVSVVKSLTNARRWFDRRCCSRH